MLLPDFEPLSSSHGNLTPPRISPSRITAISAIRKYHYRPADHGQAELNSATGVCPVFESELYRYFLGSRRIRFMAPIRN